MISTFDPSSPWDQVWEKVVSNGEFWRQMFEVPAMLIRTGSPQTSFVQGDAQISSGHQQPSGSAGPKQPKQPKTPQPSNLGQAIPGSQEVCRDFNNGRCKTTKQGGCSTHDARVHKCSICGSKWHGAHECKQKSGQKGDGKSKKAKKNKNKKKWGNGS